MVRGRTGRRAAARNQQSGGLLVSPRETPSAGKEARKDAGEKGGAALARRIVGRLIKTLESFFRKPAGRALRRQQKRRAAPCGATRPGTVIDISTEVLTQKSGELILVWKSYQPPN